MCVYKYIVKVRKMFFIYKSYTDLIVQKKIIFKTTCERYVYTINKILLLRHDYVVY